MKDERMKRASPIDVAVIGLGNWSSSLAAALSRAGISLREIVVRKRKYASTYPTVSWTGAALDAGVLWICVPDSAISEVAARIVSQRGNLRGQIVVHSSGALTVDALQPALRADASVASVHPAMSFPSCDVVPLLDVLFGIETVDPATRRVLYSLVRKLGGKPFSVASKDKALYHAAGTLASPLLVSALTAAIETAQLAGLDDKIASQWVKALAEATANNVFAQGAARSFSGPFARGDAETIRLHLQALQKHPILAGLYRSLAGHALDTLPVQNSQRIAEVLSESAMRKSDPPAGKRPKRALRMRN
jgi:predicted short-subunit dehydrogenase-like oxidoreductase (DUF2520 family)